MNDTRKRFYYATVGTRAPVCLFMGKVASHKYSIRNIYYSLLLKSTESLKFSPLYY